MAARGGRGQGSLANSAQPQPPSKKCIPAGYYSDSDYSDDDDFDFCGPNVSNSGSLPVKLPPTPMTTAVALKAGSNKSGSVNDDDDWSLPVPVPGPSTVCANSTNGIGVRAGSSNALEDEQPWPEPEPSQLASGSASKTNFGRPKVPAVPAYLKRSALPMITQINRERCIAVKTSINAAWNNGGEPGKPKDIYALGIAQTLRKEFKDAENPYATALNLMVHCNDYFWTTKSGGLGLCFEVMKEFKKWLLDSCSLASYERQFLSQELKKTAFTVIMKQSKMAVLKIVCELYCLKSIASNFIAQINQFCEEGSYKHACYAATYLGLFSEFHIHQFVIPLILQGCMDVPFEYLFGSVDSQDATVKFFDDFLSQKDPGMMLRNYVFDHKIDNVMLTTWDPRKIGKLVEKIRTKFGIDELVCSNSSRRKKFGTLRHLMYRKYIQRDDAMSEFGFEELLDDTVGNDEELIEEALAQFRQYLEPTSAAKFALRKTIPLHKITDDVQMRMHELNPNAVGVPEKAVVHQWDEDWDLAETVHAQTRSSSSSVTGLPKRERSLTPILQNSSKQGICVVQSAKVDTAPPLVAEDEPGTFYKCPIPDSDIHFVNTLEKLAGFFNELEKAQVAQALLPFPLLVVGFDAEWKPFFPTKEVALMQIALRTKIFLIDVYELSRIAHNSNCWDLFLENFFKNEKILKLGISLMRADVKMLEKTTPAWANLSKDIKGVVDLSQLAFDLNRVSPQTFQSFLPATPGPSIGLSNLVLGFTGKRVNKTEQFSNWESRPLRKAQIIYAATDAYALLDVFDAMKSKVAQTPEINFETTLVRIMERWEGQANQTVRKVALDVNVRKMIESEKNGEIQLKVPPDSPHQTPRAPKDVKLICDNMLGGICKLLRICGIDTDIVSEREARDKANLPQIADIAVQNGRYIVTTKNSYQILDPHVPPGWCYLLQNPNNSILNLRDILSYFNIVITNLQLYTRCQCCNGNEFVKIRSKLLMELYSDKAVFPVAYFTRNNVVDRFYGLMEIDEETIASNSSVSVAAKDNARHWCLLPENSLVTEGPSDVLRTKKGIMLNLKDVYSKVLTKVEHIYACNNCGKCYWPNPELRKTDSKPDSTSEDEYNRDHY